MGAEGALRIAGKRELRPGIDEKRTMQSNTRNLTQDVRYEPDEKPPPLLSIGLGLQYATLTVASIVLTPAILVGAVGGDEAYLSWVLFAALVVSGVTTVIQSARIGRIGSGYLLPHGQQQRLPRHLRHGARTGRRGG